MSEYQRVTDSNITNPDNLICDVCLNQDQHRKKLEELERDRIRDKEFAREIQKRLQRDLENEKDKMAEKQRIYQDAIKNQKEDFERRKQWEADLRKREDERLLQLMADNSDILKRLEEDQERKQNFINDLKMQIRADEIKRMKRYEEDRELSRDNDNILINDERRADEQHARKEHYKKRLLNQMDENYEQRKGQKMQMDQEDADFRRKMREALEEENRKLMEINGKKRKLFLDDVQRQLEDKERVKQRNRDLSEMEDEALRKKAMNEEDDYRDKMFKKKQQMQEYLNDIMGQKEAMKMKKDLENQAEKEYKNTGYHIPEKHEPCYNCARCRRIYPLRNLNKKKIKA